MKRHTVRFGPVVVSRRFAERIAKVAAAAGCSSEEAAEFIVELEVRHGRFGRRKGASKSKAGAAGSKPPRPGRTR